MVKSASELWGQATNTSALTASLILITLIKCLSLAAGAGLTAWALRSVTAIPVFIGVTLAGPWALTMDPVGIANPALPAWFIIGLGGASLAYAAGHRSALTGIALFSGALAHAHAASAPIGMLGLILVGIALIRHRKTRTPSWWASGATITIFALPLLARSVVYFPWPLTYFTAAEQRMNPDSGKNTERFALLEQYLGLNGTLTLSILTALCILCLLAAYRKPAWRLGSLILATMTGWAVITAWVSPPGQNWATELWWIAGVAAFWIAASASAAIRTISFALAYATGRATKKIKAWNTPFDALTALALTLLVVSPNLDVFSTAPSGAAGTSYGIDPRPAADTLSALPGPLIWVPGPDALIGGYPLLLELQRRGTEHCVYVTDNDRERGPVGLLLPHHLVCTDTQLNDPNSIYVTTSATIEVAWDTLLLQVNPVDTEQGQIPGYSVGTLNCNTEPQRDPRCPTLNTSR